MTIQEWCAKRRHSVGTYYNLKKKGRAPEVINPGVGRPHITARADREWEKNMLRWAKQDEARKMAERRSAQSAMAGRKAAESPLHISNRKKR